MGYNKKINIMKTKTLKEQIFEISKEKQLKPHSIINNCVLVYDDGKTIYAKNKKDLLNKISNL